MACLLENTSLLFANLLQAGAGRLRSRSLRPAGEYPHQKGRFDYMPAAFVCRANSSRYGPSTKRAIRFLTLFGLPAVHPRKPDSATPTLN